VSKQACIRDAREYEGLNQLYDNLPERPYWGDGKRIKGILSRDEAIQKRYIQINLPMFIKYIVFDLDYEGSAFAWEEAGLPPFTYAVINRQNAHCHAIYKIKPVFLGTASKKTKELLDIVANRYKKKLNADKVITKQKQLVKNPFHKDWEVIYNGGEYTLTELIEYIPSSKRKLKEKDSNKKQLNQINPTSRNVTLFDHGRIYAYRKVSSCSDYNDLHDQINKYLEELNHSEIPKHFSCPLPPNEINSITKSIAKWVWEKRGSFKRRDTKWNIGAMGFEKIKGLPYSKYKKEVKRRQSLAGKRTSAIRRERTYKELLDAYKELLNASDRVTQKKLSEKTGYSIRTVKYYWGKILEGAKCSNQDNSIAFGESDGLREKRIINQDQEVKNGPGSRKWFSGRCNTLKREVTKIILFSKEIEGYYMSEAESPLVETYIYGFD